VTFKSHPGGRLSLLSARPAVIFPAEERHRSSSGTKLYCLVTEAHWCEQLAQGCYADGHGETRTHDLNDRKSDALPLSHLRQRTVIVVAVVVVVVVVVIVVVFIESCGYKTK